MEMEPRPCPVHGVNMLAASVDAAGDSDSWRCDYCNTTYTKAWFDAGGTVPPALGGTAPEEVTESAATPAPGPAPTEVEPVSEPEEPPAA